MGGLGVTCVTRRPTSAGAVCLLLLGLLAVPSGAIKGKALHIFPLHHRGAGYRCRRERRSYSHHPVSGGECQRPLMKNKHSFINNPLSREIVSPNPIMQT